MSRIATACPASPAPRGRWHRRFLQLLPAITAYARFAFRDLRPEARAEAVAEVVANACQAFVRLVQLKKTDIAYAAPLARYGVRQALDGRKVGGHLNVKDVSSEYAQKAKGIHLKRLDHYDDQEQVWCEAVVEDKTAGPADIARTRIDFSDWLDSLKRRDRRVAEFLAKGETTTAAAQKFGISAGRISQLRGELAANWRKFIGDEPGAGAAMAV